MNKTIMNESIVNTPFKNELATSKADDRLRAAVHSLAEDAFHRHLISGHGDGEYANEYQIVYEGKPNHLSLSGAHAFLTELLQRST